MYVYRIENKHGLGPYSKGSTSTWQSGHHITSTGRPMPQDDIKEWKDLSYDEQHKYVFGFASLKQLQAWFRPEELSKLNASGYSIKRIRADNVVHGHTQVAFTRQK